MATTTLRTSAGELFKQLENNPGGCLKIFEEAKSQTRSVSSRLNQVIERKETDSLDGFDQMMKAAGIRVSSNPEHGYYASKATAFLRNNATRFLLVEFTARKHREMLHKSWEDEKQARAVFQMLQTRKAVGEHAPGSLARPYFDELEIEWTQRVQPSIPLERVVSRSQGIDAPDYRSYHITYDANQLRMFRVAEGADLPEARITRSEHTISLKKYGRAIRMTYEWLATITVDELGEEIQFVMAQNEVDKLAAFITIATNGDGNANTAATSHNLTVLDAAAVAGTLTAKGWSAFKKKFAGAYILTSALMQDVVATALELVNVSTADTPLIVFPRNDLRPINQIAESIDYGWTADAAASTILGLDNRRSPKHLFWVDADIQETQRFVTNQTEVMTMSEYSGFAVRDPNGARVLNIAA
jgi:hypothetical protein